MSMPNGVYTANGAIYANKHVKFTMYRAICTACNARNICTEPDKERRITCPDEIYDRWNDDWFCASGKRGVRVWL